MFLLTVAVVGKLINVNNVVFVYICGKFHARVISENRFFFFSSRRRHTRLQGDWSSDVCSSDLGCFSTG